MRYLVFGLMCLALSASAQPNPTLSGYVRDAANGEGLIGAAVYVEVLGTGATTNAYGYYSLTVPPGEYAVRISYLGYQSQTSTVKIRQSRKLNFDLEEASAELEEVVISERPPDQNVVSTEMSVSRLEMKQLRQMPALLGEVDVIRSVQLLPGISTVGEGAQGYNARGGGVDQNLILIDEGTVYNSSHLFGLFSVFNPDAVKDVMLMKGGIPAIYGGRLSSILDVRLKEGNNQQFSGSGGIGLITSRLTLEGPIAKGNSSFIVAGRRSYGDLFLRLSNDEALNNNRLYFYDLSAKANVTLSERDRLFLSGYFGRDVFKFGDDFQTDWGNGTGTLRWNHLFSDRLFANFSLVYSDYDYALGVPEGTQAFDWQAGVQSLSGKADLSYFLSARHTISFGGQAIDYTFEPGRAGPAEDNSIFNLLDLDDQRAREYAVYVDDEFTVSPALSLRYGVRLSAFDYRGGPVVYDYVGEPGQRRTAVNPRPTSGRSSVATYYNAEPRFSARYSLDERSSVKLSYNRMAQYIHLISNTTAASPLDIWSPSTNNIQPQLADQVAAGYFQNFRDNAYETSAEVFYKQMGNQIDYVDGAELLLNETLEGDLLAGEGRAYGLELYAKRNTGRLNGWVSYTLSRSERQVEGINGGAYYPVKYDRTHNLAIVGLYELNRQWSFGANFVYATGVATTFPNSRYTYEGITVPHNTGEVRNNYRVPAYHRLDISATLKGRPQRRFESSWVFSVYNVYARRNAFSIYFRQNETDPNQTEAVRLAVFGAMLPSVTYNFKF